MTEVIEKHIPEKTPEENEGEEDLHQDQEDIKPLLKSAQSFGFEDECEDYKKKVKTAPKVLCWMNVKKETTIWNLMALFVAPMVSISAGAYVNTQMPYLLQDPDYFNVPFDKVGSSVGSVLFAGSLTSTILTPFMGFLYDIIGRKLLIIPAMLGLAFQLSLIPYSAPHFWLLMVFRAVMSVLMRLVLVKPLVMDYIKSESRGVGVSIAGYGFIFGELIMISMFEATRKMSMQMQYWIPALIVATMSLSLIFLIREPTIKRCKNMPDGTVIDSERAQSLPAWPRFKKLWSEAMEEIYERPKYIFVFVCLIVSRLMNILFAVYIQLWVMSFQKTGVFATKQESDAAWRNIVIGMQVATIFLLPIFGYIADKADCRVTIPFSFAFRGVVATSFRLIDNPTSFYGYTLCILLVISSILQFLSVEALFMRNMKSTVRGTLSGIAFFFGSFGTTVFVVVGGQLFDKVGPWAPFMFVGIADFVILLFALTFIFYGKFGHNS